MVPSRLVVDLDKQVINVYGLNRYLDVSRVPLTCPHNDATSAFRLSGRADLADHNATNAHAPTRSARVQNTAVRRKEDAGSMYENHPRYNGD